MSKFKLDGRLIQNCEECSHFREDIHAKGSARYFCGHPEGPGGKLSSDLVRLQQIHAECPLPSPKTKQLIINSDDDGHYFLIPLGKEKEWNEWVQDEDNWDVPEWAISIQHAGSVVITGYYIR